MSKRRQIHLIRTRPKAVIDFSSISISRSFLWSATNQSPRGLQLWFFILNASLPAKNREEEKAAFGSRTELHLFKNSWLLTQATVHTGFAMKFWTFSLNSLFYPIFISVQQAFTL